MVAIFGKMSCHLDLLTAILHIGIGNVPNGNALWGKSVDAGLTNSGIGLKCQGFYYTTPFKKRKHMNHI